MMAPRTGDSRHYTPAAPPAAVVPGAKTGRPVGGLRYNRCGPVRQRRGAMNDDNTARKSGLWRWARRVLLALLITVAVAVVRYLYLSEKHRRDLEAATAEM